jgi:hypothetical protein
MAREDSTNVGDEVVVHAAHFRRLPVGRVRPFLQALLNRPALIRGGAPDTVRPVRGQGEHERGREVSFADVALDRREPGLLRRADAVVPIPDVILALEMKHVNRGKPPAVAVLLRVFVNCSLLQFCTALGAAAVVKFGNLDGYNVFHVEIDGPRLTPKWAARRGRGPLDARQGAVVSF